jgi:competence protein ComEA
MRAIMLSLFVSITFAACSSRVECIAATEPHTPGAININTATAADLERLPGIGRGTADAIVEHRQQNGPFRRVEHLMLIRGVSERRFLAIRPLLTAQ